ncbi:MAG: GNAT family N-acetyltransferase, partial [Nanoarchaeota archaeon]
MKYNPAISKGGTKKLAEIFIRKAVPEDAGQISMLYTDVWAGKYPISEFADSSSVEKRLAEGKDIWYVACDGGDFVGSGVGVVDKENNSMELGRAVVRKECRERGIAKRIYEQVREDALSGGIDLLWASMRNKATYDISKNDGLTAVGYSEIYFVNERELQLLGVRLSNSGKEKRIASTTKEIYCLKSVEEIIKKMMLEQKEGEYPPEAVASLQFIGRDSDICGFYYGENKAWIISSLFGHSPLPEYLQATLLIDKTRHIDFLQKLGFSITAFLPGWFLKDNNRYDCVLLTNPLVSTIIQDVGL